MPGEGVRVENLGGSSSSDEITSVRTPLVPHEKDRGVHQGKLEGRSVSCINDLKGLSKAQWLLLAVESAATISLGILATTAASHHQAMIPVAVFSDVVALGFIIITPIFMVKTNRVTQRWIERSAAQDEFHARLLNYQRSGFSDITLLQGATSSDPGPRSSGVTSVGQ